MLAGLCLGVYVFFVGVKGVDDVLAGRSGALRSRQGRLTCLLGVEQGVHEFFLVSRASVRCLLGVEQGLHDFFISVKGVGDVLAGVEQGIHVFFAGVKDVGDVLAGRESGC